MGFTLHGFTSKRVLRGIVDYEITINRDIWNDAIGVSLVFVRDKQVLGTIPLQGVESTLNPQRIHRQVVGFQLAPEFAKEAILVFQLYPNTDKVELIHLQIGTWPVTIIHEDKTQEKVALDHVQESIERK